MGLQGLAEAELPGWREMGSQGRGCQRAYLREEMSIRKREEANYPGWRE